MRCFRFILKVYFTTKIGDASSIRAKIYRNALLRNKKSHNFSSGSQPNRIKILEKDNLLYHEYNSLVLYLKSDKKSTFLLFEYR